MVVARTCDNYVSIKWAQNNAVSIEYSVTNTSESWASGWSSVSNVESGFHAEPLGRTFDKVSVRVTFADGYVYMDHADTSQCHDRSSAQPQEGVVRNPPGGGGHSGGQRVEGSYNDPATGNSFTFLTATRSCVDNSLLTTWEGNNITGIDITAYSPANAWGTDWMTADPASGQFSAPIEYDTPYRVDAAVKFQNETTVVVTVDIPDCTPAADPTEEVPNAGIGDYRLVVQINLADGADIAGAPFSLYAPQASMQYMPEALVTGVVGANNVVTIDGLVPGSYKLVVTPADRDPIEAVVAVSDQPVTQAVLTVDQDGRVTVDYVTQPGAPTSDGVSKTPTTAGTGSAVTGLPNTGVGTSPLSAGAWLTAICVVLLGAGALAVRPKHS